MKSIVLSISRVRILGIALFIGTALAALPVAGDEDMRAELDRLKTYIEALEERVQKHEAELAELRAERSSTPNIATSRDRPEHREEPVKAVARAPEIERETWRQPSTSGVDGRRFFIQSPDGNYRLNIGGRIQARYEHRRHSGREDTSSFFLRRVRVDFRGHLHDPKLTFQIMPELTGSPNLRDAWIDYQFSRSLQIRVGQFVVPFHWSRYISGNRQLLLERGLPSEAFGFPTGYDMGVGLHGHNDDNSFSYGIGLFDGAGRNVGESNSSGHMASGRVTWALSGILPREEPDLAGSEELQLTLGAGLQAANRNEVRAWDLGRSAQGNRQADWATATTDFSLRWRGLSLVTDAYLRGVSPDDMTVASYAGWAYTIRGGYFIVPGKFEIIGRYSELMLDRRDNATRETEWDIGLNLYHHGHGWKTQINYSNQIVDDGTDRIFAVQQHLSF